MKTTRRSKLSLNRSTLRSLTAEAMSSAGARGTGNSCAYSNCCESTPGSQGCVTAAYSNCAAATCFDSHCLC